MSVKTEIDRITQNVVNTYTALSRLGATMPATLVSDNLADTVDTFTLADELAEQDELLAQISEALDGKVSGGGAEPDPLADYQRVEYIESAAEETYPYIITDFVADNTCGVEVVASFPKLQDRIPMGSRVDSESTRFYCVYPMSNSSFYYGFNGGYSISSSPKVDTVYRLQTNFLNCRMVNVYDEDGIYLKGATIGSTIKLTQQTCPVSIFGYHRGDTGVVSSKREYKLYSARCSRGHEVVREYIPCYRKSDGVVGVYEKFTGAFLTAAEGTFAKGPEVGEGTDQPVVENGEILSITRP